MRLHDTVRGEVVPFEPGPEVSMYVCGITPYDATHLGHAFTSVQDSIWKGLSWCTTARFVCDGILYGLTTAGIFTWLWPGA